jgi:pyruvate carboxylase
MSEENKCDIVATESGEYCTTLNKMFRDRKPWKPADPKLIRSFMPGTVVKINVKRGDKVHAGDTLLIFRAMKMNNNIIAPMDGKIAKIDVAVGDNLPKDAVMVELA